MSNYKPKPKSNIASCLTCRHCYSWYSSPTYFDPGDSGWECSLHLDQKIEDPPASIKEDDDQAVGKYYASRCGQYQYCKAPKSYPAMYGTGISRQVGGAILR